MLAQARGESGRGARLATFRSGAGRGDLDGGDVVPTATSTGSAAAPRGRISLTDHGHHLAEQLHADYTQTPITAAYTTPPRRARETADIIANRFRLPITAEHDLREPTAETPTANPDQRRDRVRPHPRPTSRPPIPPGAETWTAYLQRTIIRPCAASSPAIAAASC
ncbi:histidine phosphatase family protein [Amycolatopsis orientalis]|uniref:histidine phosphatase family protein n=1 Tax=Amycolatopsis orientalis TaxID=31958 RepID=UPI001319E89E|nr:histidine phosphatase family protein [Amycolatopsis orientalis]